MTEKQIDIIYTYRDRDPQHVRNSLLSLQQQEDKRFGVIFIDYGSSDDFSKNVEQVCREFGFCSYYYVNTRGKMWNRGDALNHGILLSKSSDFFLSDIDMVFRPGFIEHLHILSDTGTTYFFPVGYLTKRATKKINKNLLAHVSFRKSESFASGMLLSSRKTINLVNGYNTFFSLWGLEDNDLKRRIERSNTKCEQVEEVWMLHQYHPPVNESQAIPRGWIQYMKDYYESNVTGHFSGLMQSIALAGRPAQELWSSGKLKFTEVRGRKLFLRHQLLAATSTAGNYAFHFPVRSDGQGGFVMKYGPAISKILRKIGIHAEIRSAYEEQYINAAEIRAEIYFVLKSQASKIADYYLSEERERIRLILVCR